MSSFEEKIKIPKVSVIIPTFNRAGLVEKAIQSVLEQTYRDLEIIVCDDGSTDNTVDVVRSMQTNSDLPIKLEVLPFNLGVSAARNRAIFISGGDLIAFLDSDDMWKPDKLAKQVEFLESDTRFIGVGCQTEYISQVNNSVVTYGPTYLLNESNEIFTLLYSCYIGTSCFLVKKNALILAGLFDLTLKSSEDRDLWWRLPSLGRLGYINEPLCSYRLHQSRLSNSLCGVTGKTYIPVIMKTVWYWRDKLTEKQIRQIISNAHFMVASDASAARNVLLCIKHALTAIYYRHHRHQAIKLILSTLISFFSTNKSYT